MLEEAIALAVKAHKGQKKNRSGEPYIMHVLRVMNKGKTEDENIAGVLHDIVEKSTYTITDLRKKGFSKKIVEAVDCLTRRKDESYADYIKRIKKNTLAIKVKISDLEDNMQINTGNNIKNIDLEKLAKHKKYWQELVSL